MNEANTEARFAELEIRLTHQDATVQALNDVIAEHQRLITQLRKEVEALRRRQQELSPANLAQPWEETPPPHY